MQQRICLCFWRLVTQPEADKFSQVVSLFPKYKYNTVSGHCSKTWRQWNCDSLPDQHLSLKSFLLLPFFLHCESPGSGQKDVRHKPALLTTRLPFIHSFILRVKSALCCGGGKLLWVWLWCLLWHSFPKWPRSTHSSALTSQRSLVGSTAFYSLPAPRVTAKWGETLPGSTTSPLRRVFSNHTNPPQSPKTKV